MITCRLCLQKNLIEVTHQSAQRSFWSCPTCDLVQVAKEHLPSVEVERARYLQHNNDPEQTSYVRYFDRFIDQILPKLPKHLVPEMKTIDYGCGSRPVLAQRLEQRFGIKSQFYDKFFYPNRAMINVKFQLVTCTEVVEHFHFPRSEWEKLTSLLELGGILALMTNFHQGKEQFPTWWYARDITHVSFYSHHTIKYLAQKFKMEILQLEDTVAVLRLI